MRARTAMSRPRQINLQTVKWEAADFAAAGDDKLPMGKPAEEWSYGDVDAGFKAAKLIIDESFVSGGYPHHSMETRTAFAYWQGGKCFLHGSNQSHTAAVPNIARLIGIKPEDLVFIAEFCGGGFGSKIPGYPNMAIAALMSKKISRPVMHRISRIRGIWHRQRPARASRAASSSASAPTARCSPPTSTSCRRAARISGGRRFPLRRQCAVDGLPAGGHALSRRAGAHQHAAGRAAARSRREPVRAGDRADDRQGGARARHRPDRDPQASTRRTPTARSARTAARSPAPSIKEALDKGASMFNWEERKKRSGQRNGTKVTGIGIGQGYHSAGSNGFDGLLRITPDGKLHVHTGVGNLGTYSHSATARVAAEILNYDWDNAVIERGDSRRGLPWNSNQAGSLTASTQSRTMYVAAMDMKEKLARHRRPDARRQGRRLRPRRREGGQQGRRVEVDHLCAGGAEGDRARRQICRQGGARRTSIRSPSTASP